MPMRIKGLFIVVFLSFSAMVFADKNNDSSLWLQRMNNALYNLDYEGHFVYLHNNLLEGMRISHKFEDGVLKAQLISLNGAQREVIREDKKISIIRNSAGKLRISQRAISSGMFPLMHVDPMQLQDYYQFESMGAARVAGRFGKVIMIEPRDNLRYGYRLVLDKSSSLPLDVTIVDENGNRVSQMMFTDLSINNSRSSEQSGRRDMAMLGQKIAEQARAPDASKNWYFENLPAGYQLVSYRLKRSKGATKQADHFLFSDGLATISVYVERKGSGHGFYGPTSLGSVNAYGKLLDNYKITAVGEVPMLALQQVLESLRKND